MALDWIECTFITKQHNFGDQDKRIEERLRYSWYVCVCVLCDFIVTTAN